MTWIYPFVLWLVLGAAPALSPEADGTYRTMEYRAHPPCGGNCF